MDETLEVESWDEQQRVTDSAVINEVEGTPSATLGMMTEATSMPHLTRKFKCTEVYMAPSGIMMERDVFHVIPTTAMSYPNPEEHALGVTYGEAKPQGRLFSGMNRKARRVAEKQKLKNNNKGK